MASGGPGGTEVGRISIRVVPNFTGFRSEVKREVEAVEASTEGEVDVTADFDATRAIAEFNAMLARMRAQGKDGVKVKADVDTDTSIFDRIRDKMRKIDLKPDFGVGINPAGWAVILTAITAAAAPLMGLLTTSLLSLPGMIAAVATPIAALALGFDGLKEAAAQLEDPFNDLRDTMNAAVAQQFTPVFEKLGAIFPMLSRALPAVTQGLADMADSVINTITSSEGMAKIENTIANISAALSGAAPGIGAFTNGLVTLVDQFSQKLPGIAEWFNSVGQSFSTWIDKVTADGSLSKAFDGLGATLKTVLEVIGSLAQKGFEFMSNPENVQTFVTTLQFVGAILTGIVSLSNQLWSAMTAVRQTIESITTTVLGLASGISMAATAAWSGLVTGVASAVQGIANTFAQVPAMLQGAWAGLAGIAASVWSAVVNAVRQKMAEVVQEVITGGANAVAEIASLPGKFAAALGNAGSVLVAAGRAMMAGLKQGLVDGLADVLAFAGGIAAKIAAVKGPLPYDRKVLTPAGEALMEGLGTGLENGLDPVLNNVKSFALQIMQAAKEVFGDAANIAFNFNLGGGTTMGSLLDDAKGYSQGASSSAASSVKRKMDDEQQHAYDMLGLEKERLDVAIRQKEVDAKAATDKATKAQLNADADALRLQKERLDVQRLELKNQGTLSTELANTNDDWAAIQKRAIQAPIDIGKGVVAEHLSDLGIGGQGAISQAIMGGLDYGTQFVFNVSSIDEALSVKQNEQNKQALQYTGR